MLSRVDGQICNASNEQRQVWLGWEEVSTGFGWRNTGHQGGHILAWHGIELLNCCICIVLFSFHLPISTSLFFLTLVVLSKEKNAGLSL